MRPREVRGSVQSPSTKAAEKARDGSGVVIHFSTQTGAWFIRCGEETTGELCSYVILRHGFGGRRTLTQAWASMKTFKPARRSAAGAQALAGMTKTVFAYTPCP